MVHLRSKKEKIPKTSKATLKQNHTLYETKRKIKGDFLQ